MNVPLNIFVHQGDLPDDLDLGDCVAIDTETMGLKPARDRLCLVQLSSGNGDCHLVQMPDGEPGGEIAAPNLKALLTDPAVLKLFHFARFDVAVMKQYLAVETAPVYCTKIASKLVRTYTDRHGLKDLCRELLGVELSKQQQSSDWGAAELSEDQRTYAATDVLYLHRLKNTLDQMIDREGRRDLLSACLGFIPVRADLDLLGWADEDIFHH